MKGENKMKVYSIVTGTVRSIRELAGGVRRIQVEHETDKGEFLSGFVTEFVNKENPARPLTVGQNINAGAYQAINTYEKKNGDVVHEIKTTLLSKKAEEDFFTLIGTLINKQSQPAKKDLKL